MLLVSLLREWIDQMADRGQVDLLVLPELLVDDPRFEGVVPIDFIAFDLNSFDFI